MKDVSVLKDWLSRNLAAQKRLSESRRDLYSTLYGYLLALDLEDTIHELSDK